MSDTGQSSQLPPDKPLSPNVLIQPLASSPILPNDANSKTYTVNKDDSGNLILMQLNDSGTLVKDSQDKDFFSSNEFPEHGTPDENSMEVDGTKQRSKRSYSNSEVGDDELGHNQGNTMGGGRAKSARTQDDGPNRSDVFSNKGKSRILIIKSMDNLKIFSNPNQTLRFLETSELNKVKSGPHEVQGRGGCLKMEVSLDTDFDFTKLTKFDNHNIRAWFPASDKNSMGVIYPIDKDVPLDSIFANLSILDDNSACTPLELKRLQNKEGPTDLVKITFEGDLPNKVSLWGQVYNVRKYNRNPIICYKCSRWGHGLITCSASAKCGFCGGNHLLDGCTKDGTPRCLHCGEGHITGARSCCYYSSAVKIETLRSKNLISYDESKELYRDLNNKRFISLDYKLTKYNSSKLPPPGNNQTSTKKPPTNVGSLKITLTNYYESLSDDMDNSIDLNDSISSSVRPGVLYSAKAKTKPKKPVRKKITVTPSEIGAIGVSKEGNCLFDDWGIPTDNVSPVNPPETRSTSLNNEPLNNRKPSASRVGKDSNLHRRNKNIDANNDNNVNQKARKENDSNDSSLSFFYSVITKLVDFMKIKDKTSESCALFAWKVFDLVARFYDFSF